MDINTDKTMQSELIHKTCPICKKRKKASEFGKYFSKARGKYRLQNYCNGCSKVEKTKRSAEYFQRHRETRLQYAKDYRKDPKNKEKLKTLSTRFKQKYREELKDCYVVDSIAQKLKVPAKAVKEIDGLVEVERARLKLIRTIKNKRK